ncbi:MAG: pyruvate kinase [Phycisphaerales bacterium]
MSAAAPLTRIVATVGPATTAPATLSALIDAGVAVFRLNFSHGTLDEHRSMLRAIRAAEDAAGRLVATLADLPGPKIRTGVVDGAGIELAAGQVVRLGAGDRCETGPGGEARIACTYAGIVDDVEVGHRVLIDDGAIRLLVVERRGRELVASVIVPGVVKSRKGINVPDSVVRTDPITERDRQAAAFAVQEGVDFIGMSFVQEADDVRRLRDLVAHASQSAGRATPPRIVAKIERPQAVDHIDAIVDIADAVMVARGDLGVEMDLAKVPVVQKRVIAAARAAGRPSIVATQMLQSMIESPSPTRAEVSDVANAIFDGCDAVMLSGETAVGKWPVVAVETMTRIAREAEAHVAATAAPDEPPARLVRERNRIAAFGHGAMRAARDLGVAGIVAWSHTGTTALLLSRYRFAVPIRAVSTDVGALRGTRLCRGVEPMLVAARPRSASDFVAALERRLRDEKLIRTGDLCLYISGEAFGADAIGAAMTLREVGAERPEAEPIADEAGAA